MGAGIAAQALARPHRAPQGLLVPGAHRLMGYRVMHYQLQADLARHAL